MAEFILLLLVIVGCLVLSSFFSGVETAVISTNKLRLKHMADRGNEQARGLYERMGFVRVLTVPGRIVKAV